jgi:hypothetical protein
MSNANADYHSLRNALRNADRIGNDTMVRYFAGKMGMCKYVMPEDWRPHTCFTSGIPLRGRDIGNTATWRTKAKAQVAARDMGWPAQSVTKVYCRIHGERWALVDGRFGLLSRAWVRSRNQPAAALR